MVYESSDASFLRMMEALLESAPQIVLQIYILAQAQYDNPNHISWTECFQFISISASLLSLGFAYPSYVRLLRESDNDANDLSLTNTIVLGLWQFFVISARVITLGLFASLMLPYFSPICFIHFCLHFLWIRGLNTNYCHNKFGEYGYNLVLSIMLIFIFINPKGKKTQIRYIVYYTEYFIESLVLITIWYCNCPSEMNFRFPALIMVIVFLILAVFIMVIYYTILHPTRGIPMKTCIFRFANYIKEFHPETYTVE